MILGRVIGRVISTCKDDKLDSQKLLMVEPIDPSGNKVGGSFIAVDRVGAGKGEVVIIVKEGSVVADLFGSKKVPLQAIIVGIVDKIKLKEDLYANG